MLALAAYPLVWVYSWSMPPMKPPTFNAIHQVPFDSEHGWTGSVFIITGSLLQLTVSMYAVFLSSTKMMASFLLTPSILHSQCSASDRFILNWTGPTYFESIRRAVELFTGELLQEMWLRLVGGPVACRLLGSVTSTSQSRREPRLEALIDRLLGTVSSPLASQSRDDTTECRLRESSLSRGDMNERLLDRPTRSHADVKEAIRERRASTSTNKQAGESTSNSQSDIECAVRSASASSSDLKAIKGHLKEIDEILTAELGDPTNPLDNASTRELLEILCKREAASRRPS
ncbi:MAG: hypothetical protein KVP17_003227 [Porospora cf. gigantea B]|nr:MAG: hypothetical protein KVP17_003227 [Porospora cf. gigantea B]